MLRYAPTIVFAMALSAAGLFLYLQRNSSNTMYEYCTTKAYGVPFPWRIDNCECDGGQTEYPMDSVVWNASLALAGAFGISRLVPKMT
jgi:hypothetical protein